MRLVLPMALQRDRVLQLLRPTRALGESHVVIIIASMPTLASQSRRLVPSAPDQNRDRMTVDCAMIS